MLFTWVWPGVHGHFFLNRESWFSSCQWLHSTTAFVRGARMFKFEYMLNVKFQLFKFRLEICCLIIFEHSSTCIFFRNSHVKTVSKPAVQLVPARKCARKSESKVSLAGIDNCAVPRVGFLQYKGYVVKPTLEGDFQADFTRCFWYSDIQFIISLAYLYSTQIERFTVNMPLNYSYCLSVSIAQFCL